MFLFRRKEKSSNESFIIKTNDEKIIENGFKKKKEICPNCGRYPIGGKFNGGLSFGLTDGIYTTRTCSHCNCDYKHKR